MYMKNSWSLLRPLTFSYHIKHYFFYVQTSLVSKKFNYDVRTINLLEIFRSIAGFRFEIKKSDDFMQYDEDSMIFNMLKISLLLLLQCLSWICLHYGWHRKFPCQFPRKRGKQFQIKSQFMFEYEIFLIILLITNIEEQMNGLIFRKNKFPVYCYIIFSKFLCSKNCL